MLPFTLFVYFYIYQLLALANAVFTCCIALLELMCVNILNVNIEHVTHFHETQLRNREWREKVGTNVYSVM